MLNVIVGDLQEKSRSHILVCSLNLVLRSIVIIAIIY